MPWLAVPFDSPFIDQLAKEYQVNGIPRLVIVDLDGSIVSNDAKHVVAEKSTLPEYP